MRVIAIINQKGGCGKTTTAINLSGCLTLNKRRVLLIDLDSQGHASLGLNLKPEEVTRGMTEVLTQGTYLDDVIRETNTPNLDLASSTSMAPISSTVVAMRDRIVGESSTIRTFSDILIPQFSNITIIPDF